MRTVLAALALVAAASCAAWTPAASRPLPCHLAHRTQRHYPHPVRRRVPDRDALLRRRRRRDPARHHQRRPQLAPRDHPGQGAALPGRLRASGLLLRDRPARHHLGDAQRRRALGRPHAPRSRPRARAGGLRGRRCLVAPRGMPSRLGLLDIAGPAPAHCYAITRPRRMATPRLAQGRPPGCAIS